MNAPLVCLLAALAGDPDLAAGQPVDADGDRFSFVVRGQDPQKQKSYNPDPQSALPPTGLAPPFGGIQPMQMPSLFPAMPGPSATGAVGPQPYRLWGWQTRADVGLLPNSNASGNYGSLGIFEVDTEFEYSLPMPDNFWIFSFTQEFNLRTWEGPSHTSGTGLPGSLYRFGWNLELETPATQPWSIKLAVNPSLNSDFAKGLTRDAWQFDGHGLIAIPTSPEWMMVLGAGYWDRVHDKVIPYAGVVWRPGSYTEWRILFPESRISYFLGNAWGVSQWLYLTGEYHVESYEIQLDGSGALAGQREQVDLEDWRALLGLRTESPGVSSFIEAGWVFGRHVDFRGAAPDFDLATGFIARMGLRF